MIKSLRRKFVAVTMVIVALFLTVILGSVVHTTAAGLEAESFRFLRQAAQAPLQPGQARFPCFVIRVTPFGQMLERSGFEISDTETLTEVVSLAAASASDEGELGAHSLRFYRLKSPGELTIAFADISGEQTTLRNLTLSCIAIGAGAMLCFWLVSVWLVRWATKPVEEAWNQQRQFIADASHELKTPLTVITTNAELLLESPDPAGQYAGSILTMSRRMRSLVEGLLELARVDGGAVKAAFEDTDLSELISGELLPFEPVYFEQGLELHSQVEPGLRVLGSPRHLRQAVSILLDNAAKYTPAPADVQVRLFRQGGQAVLTVSNPGTPLSREECQRIFRRFYRLDAARTSGGYGLGLPIALAIAQDHRGTLRAESRDGQNIFTLRLPVK